MLKILLYILVLFPFCLFAQEATINKDTSDLLYIRCGDSLIVSKKSIAFKKQRAFTITVKEKYTGSNFEYKAAKKKKKEKKTPKPNLTFLIGFAQFMKTIFPFLLAAIVVYIIVKLYFGNPNSLWSTKPVTKKVADKLVYEEDDIENTDIESLLNQAIANKDTRLAIRYYYLLLLKKLSAKEVIKYDKDKTNSEYLFEIKSETLRKEFSYLSYIYSYVWYGEFLLNENDFIKVQERYQSFFKTIN